MTETQSRSTLTCLKCGGAMRTYERSGVLIDQCTECRGIFLDRGELDRIVDAEGSRDGEAHLDSGRPPADDDRGPSSDRRSRDDRDDVRWRDDDDDDRRPSRWDATGRAPSQPRKRSSLLGSVVDILGGGE